MVEKYQTIALNHGIIPSYCYFRVEFKDKRSNWLIHDYAYQYS